LSSKFVGLLCAVKINEWRRGVIADVSEYDTVEVELVDFGGSRNVATRHLEREFGRC
jgi:hypothetical protein